MRTAAVFTRCLSSRVRYRKVALDPSGVLANARANASKSGVGSFPNAVMMACFGTPPRPRTYPGSATYTDPAGS